MEPYQVLEHKLGEWCGRPGKVVVCNSGTAALHLAIEAFNLPLPGRFMVPDYSMIACPRAVAMSGLKPYLVPVDHKTLIITPDTVNDTLKSRLDIPPTNIKGLMAVHTYGRRCDMDGLAEIADEHELFLVEDLAEAHGVAPHPRTDAACWSFYRNKIVAGEEGGAVAFLCDEHVERAKCLRSLGFTADHDYFHKARGHNYRLANLLVSPIFMSLEDLPENTRKRAATVGWYHRSCPTDWQMPPREANWVYDFRIPGINRETQTKVVKYFNDRGVAARHGFVPLHLQDEFYASPGATRAAMNTPRWQEIIYLPIVPSFSWWDTAFYDLQKMILGTYGV